ncbi:FAD-binding protein [Haloferax sp. MBLA0077]|uniref:FAD-binding protein n=3 Tax=Haloferacaceae TaxID=1644056 RepID=A0A6G1Z341_9EURY|nr:FAD-binding protein [Haloferax sp. CBA1149]MRW80952.1 FAD-binding protein [Haloferax marinisediminis]
MTRVIVVGGGPAGLSSALFASKNGLDVDVFDTDKTWLHSAHLFNYLGIESKDGTEFLEDAREQVEGFGATLHDGEVTAIEQSGDGFVVTVDDEGHEADYVVLATGAKRTLAEEVGCAFTDDGVVEVDVTMETSIENLYATGAMVRAEEWQAIISAGDGAAAALNILTKEEGEHFHDFDTPEDAK